MTCRERYYLQEPIASPMEGGQNGRVNVTAVDALTKYKTTQKKKKKWILIYKTNKAHFKWKSKKNVKNNNTDDTSRRQGFSTGPWQCNIHLPGSLAGLSLSIKFLFCCCARYERKYSNDIFLRKKKNRKSLTDERRERIGHFCLFPVISDTKNLNLELVVCWLHILTVFVSLRKGRDRRVDNGRLCATHSRCRD